MASKRVGLAGITLHRIVAALSLLFTTIATAQIPEQYPMPLVHTPTNHPAAHVLLLSIDGMHAFDLATFVRTHPDSTLAALSARGVTYSNARTPIADPAAGLASLVTGGTPISTGIISVDGLLPNGPVAQMVTRVNTIFEVVHEKIGPTAWSAESSSALSIVRGPSGQGVDEACPLHLTPDGDLLRVRELLHQIDAEDCAGTHPAPVPVLFGMSFTALADAQRTAGYVNALGEPSPALSSALETIDRQIGQLNGELAKRNLQTSTWVAVVSPFGQSPIDPRQHRTLPSARIEAVARSCASGSIRHITDGGSILLWLNNLEDAANVARAFNARAAELGIATILSGDRLTLALNSPARDAAMPDIILTPEPGLLWTGKQTTVGGTVPLAAYGGMSDDDTHVALLVSGTQLTGRSDPTLLPTTQLSPLLLRALGVEKFDLQALHMEHSPALPGIF